MKTLSSISVIHGNIPPEIAWYLSDLGESRGRQELFTRQSPQRLKVLREHAIIESAVSSNRIEGIEIENSRIGTVIFGRPSLRDRNEEEIHGYMEALNLIHERGPGLPVSEETVMRLHSLCRGRIWDAGHYKEKDGDIIEKYPDGTSRIRFKTLSAAETPGAMNEIISLWEDVLKEQHTHPLILMAAFNLDFLCIHPFRDGNGRVSRLLLLLQCYHLGFEVGRYISIERLIEQNKERYYETLEMSSRGWHDGSHDPWPYIGYILYILKSSYVEFENRFGMTRGERGEKTALIISAIDSFTGQFSVSDILKQCPGISVDMVRRVLKDLKAGGDVECLGLGQSARWIRK